MDLEYLANDEIDDQYEKIAEPYLEDIDFAFFVVNFGYTKADYEALTPAEKLFIRKAYEDKTVGDSSLFEKAVEVAIGNTVCRKKGKRALSLWQKQQRPADKVVVQKQIEIVNDVEEKNGKNWVQAIYQAAGIKMPEKGVINHG